jgi:penicillin V acylase-like amidase (Ntn superfamily)
MQQFPEMSLHRTKYKRLNLQYKLKINRNSLICIAGIDVLEKPVYADAMNEKGLVAGLFYHPGFAEYLDYDPSMADSSMGPTDVIAVHPVKLCECPRGQGEYRQNTSC